MKQTHIKEESGFFWLQLRLFGLCHFLQPDQATCQPDRANQSWQWRPRNMNLAARSNLFPDFGAQFTGYSSDMQFRKHQREGFHSKGCGNFFWVTQNREPVTLNHFWKFRNSRSLFSVRSCVAKSFWKFFSKQSHAGVELPLVGDKTNSKNCKSDEANFTQNSDLILLDFFSCSTLLRKSTNISGVRVHANVKNTFWDVSFVSKICKPPLRLTNSCEKYPEGSVSDQKQTAQVASFLALGHSKV